MIINGRNTFWINGIRNQNGDTQRNVDCKINAHFKQESLGEYSKQSLNFTPEWRHSEERRLQDKCTF